MLGITALVIDQNQRVGDNWRERYHQLVLHDPVWYDHMPYLPFPPQWPVFTPKDKFGDWLEGYASAMELNVWTGSELSDASWSDAESRWTVQITRKASAGSLPPEKRVFHPRHIIQATGQSGQKYLPAVPGMDTFVGKRLCHSSEFYGAEKDGKGLKAVVVGSCNSGHDIAQEFVAKGYDVTMVQRSSTTICSSYAITDIAFKGLYCEDGPPVDDADLLVHSMPNSLQKSIFVDVTEAQRKYDKDILDGLERAGFKVNFGPDQAGLFFTYLQHGGGYYIDVGASKLIVEGRIKIKQGEGVTEVLPHGVRLAGGSELTADEVIFATGYQSMNSLTRQIFGDEVADRVAETWGFNEEGECRTVWQRSGHPGFWYHGGNIAFCRYFSRLLALQIKGLEEDLYKYDEI